MAVPSDAHLLAFGRIMFNYAKVELGIKIALSGILGINVGYAMVVFQPYGALDLKNVAKSLAKERLDPKSAEQFCCLIGEWAAFSSLRNSIAHNSWAEGDRPGALKPRYLSIREGRVQMFGEGDDRRDYTARELDAESNKLYRINERLKRYTRESGLRAVIDAKIEAHKLDMSEGSGKDGKQSSK